MEFAEQMKNTTLPRGRVGYYDFTAQGGMPWTAEGDDITVETNQRLERNGGAVAEEPDPEVVAPGTPVVATPLAAAQLETPVAPPPLDLEIDASMIPVPPPVEGEAFHMQQEKEAGILLLQARGREGRGARELNPKVFSAEERSAFDRADAAELRAWRDKGAIQELNKKQAAKIFQEKPDRILPGVARVVRVNKSKSGLEAKSAL